MYDYKILKSAVYEVPENPETEDKNFDFVVDLIEGEFCFYGVTDVYVNGLDKKLRVYDEIANIGERSLFIDDEKIVGGSGQNFFVYDIRKREIIFKENVGTWIDDLFLLSDGYFFHGEQTNGFFDENYCLKWTFGCVDIFETPSYIPPTCRRLSNGNILVYDWTRTAHIYDKNGLVKTISTEERVQRKRKRLKRRKTHQEKA